MWRVLTRRRRRRREERKKRRKSDRSSRGRAGVAAFRADSPSGTSPRSACPASGGERAGRTRVERRSRVLRRVRRDRHVVVVRGALGRVSSDADGEGADNPPASVDRGGRPGGRGGSGRSARETSASDARRSRWSGRCSGNRERERRGRVDHLLSTFVFFGIARFEYVWNVLNCFGSCARRSRSVARAR